MNIYELEEFRESCLIAYISTKSDEAKNKYIETERLVNFLLDNSATHCNLENENDENIKMWKDVDAMNYYKSNLEKLELWNEKPIIRTGLKQIYLENNKKK